jgi:hypothetical protein
MATLPPYLDNFAPFTNFTPYFIFASHKGLGSVVFPPSLK